MHFLGGWGTPDRATRAAVPAAEHWSVGLNADGTSEHEWRREAALPAGLVGAQALAAVALTPGQEDDGEPAIFAWVRSRGGWAPSEAACYKQDPPAAALDGDSGSKRHMQLWSFARSVGWQQSG